MVNLLSRYPDASICGYPTDNDIIKLVLLAIYFIKTHGSESRGQGGSTLRRPRRTHVSILQEQTLLK